MATDDDNLARIARSIRDWGRDCYCAGGESNTCGKRFSQQFGALPFAFITLYLAPMVVRPKPHRNQRSYVP